MKVLFVYPYCAFPPDLILDILPSYLAKRGYEIDIVSHVKSSDEKKLYARLKQKPIRFHLVEAISFSIPGLVADFPFFLSLETMIKKLQPDIIHINNLPFLTTVQSTQLAKKMGIASIVQVHGVIAKRNKLLDFAQYFYINTLGRSVFRDATFVICLTESDAKEIRDYGCPLEKIRIIPNGVDVEKFKSCEEVMDDLIFWGGRFVPEKGLTFLINAFHLVVVKKPEVKLMMAGDGPLFSRIYDIVRQLGIEKNVVLKGRVPHSELPYLISAASICVLPSLKEGMPYALLEAMACGKPVVGSDIPGINDVITHGENGILVPPKNPKALADAIMLLLEDENLRMKLGQNARRLMVEKYSWDTISEKIEKVYNEALNYF